MKTAVSNKEIVHLWGKQDYAKGSNCYFRDNKFYSYSTEIAAIRTNSKGQEAVFIDDTSYSITTSKHQSSLRWAVRHLTIFNYTSNNSKYNSYSKPSTVTADYLYQHYIEQATELSIKSSRAKKADYKVRYIEQAKAYLEKANSIIDWFRVDLERLDEGQFDDLLTRLTADAEVARKQAEDIRKAKLALDLEFYKESFERWLAGEAVNFPGCYHDKGIFLRVVKDTVETSRGAKFPVDSCETIFKVYKKAVDKNEVYSDYIKVGHYTVSHISRKGIIAGCHTIKPKEIERFAKVLKLV